MKTCRLALSVFSTAQAPIKAKNQGVFVALSLNGSKKSGAQSCEYSLPPSLFEEESINYGRSMLKRVQMERPTLECKVVADRLLLTHSL